MKRSITIVAVLLFWAACGYVNYGLELGYFTHKFPCADHRAFAWACAFGGPFALPASFSETPLHWRTRPLTVEERWNEFHKRWPPLSREDFERSFN